jgi:hypothetical protein
MAETEADYNRFHLSSVFIGRSICADPPLREKAEQLVDCGSQRPWNLKYSVVQESINAVNLGKLRQLFHDVICLIS